MKILNNGTYLLLIDEEAEILCRNKEILLSKDESLLCEVTETNHRQHFRGINIVSNVEVSISYHQTNDYYKVVAYYPLTKEAKKLDLPLLPNPFEEEVESIFNKKANIPYFPANLKETCRHWFKEGYKAATKQFSLDDMEKAIEMAREYEFVMYGDGETEHKYFAEEIIQSLSTQQLPNKFIPEYETIISKYIPYPKELEVLGQGYEVGYPVTEKVLKTKTNSEGKEELVGTWKY